MNRSSRSKLAASFVRLLAHHPRNRLIAALTQAVVELQLTNQLDLLLKDIDQELLKQHGRLEAEVVSARQLNDQVLNELKRLLKNRTGAHTVRLNQKINRELLGGLVATTPELEIDLSIRSRLRQLESYRG